MFDLDWIQRLIRIVDESDVDTLEVSRFATKVRISKSPPQVSRGGGAAPAAPPPAAGAAGGTGAAPTPPGGASRPSGAPPAGEGAAVEAPEEPAEQEAASGTESDLHEVTSPMVGTFYRAPAPDAPAYVEVGDRVEEVVSGVVEEICAENAEPVEYGDVLFRIDTDA